MVLYIDENETSMHIIFCLMRIILDSVKFQDFVTMTYLEILPNQIIAYWPN